MNTDKLKDLAHPRVLVVGCFDLFHRGHLALLERARRCGVSLIVGVVTDEFRAKTKGAEPIIPFSDRAIILAGLRCVDAVVEVREPDFRPLIKEYGIDVFVHSPEHREIRFLEATDVIRRRGGHVVLLSRTPDISSTMIRRRIVETWNEGRVE